jgi:hypothetical protein
MGSVERAIYRSAAAICLTLVLVAFWITSSSNALKDQLKDYDGSALIKLGSIESALVGPLDVRVVR